MDIFFLFSQILRFYTCMMMLMLLLLYDVICYVALFMWPELCTSPWFYVNTVWKLIIGQFWERSPRKPIISYCCDCISGSDYHPQHYLQSVQNVHVSLPVIIEVDTESCDMLRQYEDIIMSKLLMKSCKITDSCLIPHGFLTQETTSGVTVHLYIGVSLNVQCSPDNV